MEKLQKALQIAREQRAGHTTAVQQPVARDDAWEALPREDPDVKLLEANRIVSTQVKPVARPFDILRTKVLLNMRKNGWKRLAVTSPEEACGKTTLACNLVLGFSRQSDVRTILFEFDLRRPTIAKRLRLPARPNISEMLHGDVDFADQAVRLTDSVAVSAASAPVADPTSTILNQKTHDTLADIEARYSPDIVVFDLPPLLLSDEAQAFLKDVDCALMVARAESTTVAQIDACERGIAEHTNVLGVVLNQCRHGDDVHLNYADY